MPRHIAPAPAKPAKPRTTPSRGTSLRLDDSLQQRVERAKARTGLNKSSLMKLSLLNFLDEVEKGRIPMPTAATASLN